MSAPLRFLVTGASGLLGVNFLLTAQQLGHCGWALYHRHSLASQELGFDPRQLDLTHTDQLHSSVESCRPDWIIHTAALTNVDQCQTNPQLAQELNVKVTDQLAQLSQRLGCGLLYISTDSVFNGMGPRFTEDDPTQPVNVYATTKLEGEAAALQAPRSVVVRTAFYGSSLGHKTTLAEWILAQLQGPDPVPGFVDALFTPFLVNDLSRLLIQLTESECRGVFHVGSRDEISKYNFVRGMAQQFGYSPDRVVPLSVASSHLSAPRPQRTSLAVDKISATLGQPMPSVVEGLARFQQLLQVGHLEKLRRLRA